ncbi:hypothetical protein [Nocardia sp. NPDC004415]
MARKVVDVDDTALAAAARFLETTTDNETVEAALNAVTDHGRRTEAIARMRALVAEGEIDSAEADPSSGLLRLRRFASGDPTLAPRTVAM